MTANPFQSNLSDDERLLLSSYIDDQLTPDERNRLEQRLQAEPDLRTELEELRATTMLLRDTPPLVPPRSFTLDPDQVRTRRPLLSGWVRLGSALAAIVLALTFTGAFIFYGQTMSGGSVAQIAEEPATAPRTFEAAETAAPLAEQGPAMSDAAEDAAEQAADEAATLSEATEAVTEAEMAEPEEAAPAAPPTLTAAATQAATIQPTPIPVEPDGVTLAVPEEEHTGDMQATAPLPEATVPEQLSLTPLPQSPETLGSQTRDLGRQPTPAAPAEPGRPALLPLAAIALLLMILLAGAWYVWQRRSRR
ncbi:MAG: anti-sigma factor family protein [Chloroflexaceae bacterium]